MVERLNLQFWIATHLETTFETTKPCLFPLLGRPVLNLDLLMEKLKNTEHFNQFIIYCHRQNLQLEIATQGECMSQLLSPGGCTRLWWHLRYLPDLDQSSTNLQQDTVESTQNLLTQIRRRENGGTNHHLLQGSQTWYLGKCERDSPLFHVGDEGCQYSPWVGQSHQISSPWLSQKPSPLWGPFSSPVLNPSSLQVLAQKEQTSFCGQTRHCNTQEECPAFPGNQLEDLEDQGVPIRRKW